MVSSTKLGDEHFWNADFPARSLFRCTVGIHQGRRPDAVQFNTRQRRLQQVTRIHKRAVGFTRSPTMVGSSSINRMTCLPVWTGRSARLSDLSITAFNFAPALRPHIQRQYRRPFSPSGTSPLTIRLRPGLRTIARFTPPRVHDQHRVVFVRRFLASTEWYGDISASRADHGSLLACSARSVRSTGNFFNAWTLVFSGP